MDLQEQVNQKLLKRGFSEKTLLNNRGLIGAVIEETGHTLRAEALGILPINYEYCDGCGCRPTVLYYTEEGRFCKNCTPEAREINK